ncbi:MAG: hypothetical protein ACLP1X_32600 [Polyangiaceae bacterium]
MTKRKTTAFLLLAFAASGCFTTGEPAASGDDGGVEAGDATVVDDAQGSAPVLPTVTPAEKAACTANPTGCLTGTAAASRFATPPAQMQAKLYRVFPYGTEPSLSAELVDDAGTWVFAGPPGADAGLDPWGHYYVQIEADFNVDAGVGSAVAKVVGPLGVPSGGQPIAVDVPPVQLNVLESRVPGGPMQLQWVLAHVFDPTSGAEIKDGATVAIAVGANAVTVPWSGGGVDAYFFQFPTPPAAQPSYMVTVSAPPFGAAPVTFQLLAVEPAFDGAIVAPDSGASVPANSPLSIVWEAEPQADYEIVQVFQSSGFASVYVSPQPDPPNQTEETVEAGLEAGSYLVNVSYAKTNCPASANGCVQANTVSAANVTAN